MSDSSEKPFEATPQRIERARREGDVARAGELSANAAFAAAVGSVAGAAPWIGAAARAAIAEAARGRAPWGACAMLLAFALSPIAAAAVVGAAASIAQTGGLHPIVPVPKFERLNPLAGARRTFSRETLAHVARTALAGLLAGAAMLVPIFSLGAALLQTEQVGPIAAGAWSAAQHAALTACAVGTLFAIAEFSAARSAWLRKLRMSFEERKREVKEQDGDPHARGQRRRLHRSLVRGAIARVREAAFVVANPTHVAVALAYKPPAIAVPRVLVLAAGEAALRLRRVADRYSIPVVENVPLARALYRDAHIDAPIAPAHYVAVAEVVAALVRAQKLDRC